MISGAYQQCSMTLLFLLPKPLADGAYGCVGCVERPEVASIVTSVGVFIGVPESNEEKLRLMNANVLDGKSRRSSVGAIIAFTRPR
jgi:hypothetical protein